MSKPIIFYDLLRKGPEGQSDSEKSWSPNTLKTRLALNIKGLQFKTEWLSFVAIGPKMKELGVPPRADAEGLKYTIPTIYDPNTGKTVTESLAIAKYLDKTYPDTPRLVASGTAGLQEAYLEKVVTPFMYTMMVYLVYPAFKQSCVTQADEEYLRKKGQALMGKQPEDMVLQGEAITTACKSLSASLGAMAQHVFANGGDAVFVTGDSPSHVDTAIASILSYIIKTAGKDHALSKVIMEHSWANNYLEAMSEWR
ncbi:hypothetical protein PENSPDRAFT_679987 [Peniophora sp. CONT]|nr:hypothetical protein PENSPDRAFT_679987 [Peniophora sp. CONT]